MFGVKNFIAGVMIAGCMLSAAVSAETWRVGTEPSFPPFEFMTADQQLTGFDIDLIKAVAAAQGAEIEFSKVPFDSLIPGLLTGSLDLAISGITITEERAKRVDFSAPYYDSGLSAVVLSKNTDKFKTLADLKTAKLCVMVGTTGAMHTDIAASVAQYNTNVEAMMELKNGGCDAVLSDKPVNEYFITTSGNGQFAQLEGVLDAEQYGMAVKKGNAAMLEKIKAGLDKIRQDGTYDAVYGKWFNAR